VTVDPSVLQATLIGHSDAIWGLSMHNSKMHLLSCSSDATVRLWNPIIKSPLLSTFRIDTGMFLCSPSANLASQCQYSCYKFSIAFPEVREHITVGLMVISM